MTSNLIHKSQSLRESALCLLNDAVVHDKVKGKVKDKVFRLYI